MKRPPVVDTEKNTNTYLMGDKVLYGFPNRTYFELYSGSCKSDKLYSVQNKNMPEGVAAVVYDPQQNKNVDLAEFRDGQAVGREHVFVEYTSELAELLRARDIRTDVVYYVDANKANGMRTWKDAAWVNPSAFTWIAADDADIEVDVDVDYNKGDKTPKKTNRAILAAIVAAITLLN